MEKKIEHKIEESKAGSNVKQMLVLSGSPRKKGLLNQMLEEAVRVGEKSGYEVHYYNLCEEEIAKCRGCMVCRQTGSCVIEDAAGVIGQKIRESSLVVVGSPTYFANVSASVKLLFDRIVAVMMDDNASSIPKAKLTKGQKYILMTTCNTPFPFDRLAHQSTGCIRAMKEVFHIAGMTMAGKVIAAGTKNNRRIPSAKIQRLIAHCR